MLRRSYVGRSRRYHHRRNESHQGTILHPNFNVADTALRATLYVSFDRRMKKKKLNVFNVPLPALSIILSHLLQLLFLRALLVDPRRRALS